MKISPITNQNNKTSFQSVNMKYYNEAKRIYEKYAPYHDVGTVLTEIDLAHAYSFINNQDAIDTLNAIRPFAQNALEVVDYMVKQIKSAD